MPEDILSINDELGDGGEGKRDHEYDANDARRDGDAGNGFNGDDVLNDAEEESAILEIARTLLRLAFSPKEINKEKPAFSPKVRF